MSRLKSESQGFEVTPPEASELDDALSEAPKLPIEIMRDYVLAPERIERLRKFVAAAAGFFDKPHHNNVLAALIAAARSHAEMAAELTAARKRVAELEAALQRLRRKGG